MYEPNENPWGDPQTEPQHEPVPSNVSNALSAAALVCAVLSVVSVCCLYGAFVFGGLAIAFALLSRGSRKKTAGPAHIALILGIVGIIISIAVTVGSMFALIRQYGSLDNFLERYRYTLEQNFGIDLDDNSDSDTDSEYNYNYDPDSDSNPTFDMPIDLNDIYGNEYL